MSILAITSGLYSNEDEIIRKLTDKFNIDVLTDADIIDKTHQRSKIKLSTLQKTVESKPIAFNDFTHEKEKCLALLKQTLSEAMQKGDCIFHGFLSHLIPKEISHIMRILIITDKKNRIANGMEKNKLNEKEATRDIEEADKYAALWTNSIFQKKAWDESLFDIVIPSDKTDSDESVALISKNLEKLLSNKEDLIKKELFDFKLIADIDVALSEIGTGLITEADNGNIMVTIDKKVMMLSSFQQKIVKTVETIPGVKSVETKIGHNYYKGNIIRNYEFETPLRILLVDDEKEFVQTLSERLKMRQFTSEIAYNGQEALDFTEQEDTEVMILDLKMPGIDGFEVLKKIKKSKPDIEVIILTGHGTETDKKTCMDLGAFAYLQKPADIDLITETMKKAYQKITARKTRTAE
ncbi:MAG: response regulator [Proteobacteria bacterium]|nr:response regulator [Pseudomonadota bacterium]MBU1386722.1 response regulator [Pseudomonadota bacterium]MBU1544370.1 response regulator [Pseudomonadota bacterium]MBU2481748.1 response regulator [Pseudomonadota bacterium]